MVEIQKCSIDGCNACDCANVLSVSVCVAGVREEVGENKKANDTNCWLSEMKHFCGDRRRKERHT